jgi:hypothetical protein
VEAAANDEELQRIHRSQGQAQAPALLEVGQRAESGNQRTANCPGCGRSGSDLKWIYFSSPAWTWQRLCGRAGWLAICEPCHMQVAFFMEVMN